MSRLSRIAAVLVLAVLPITLTSTSAAARTTSAVDVALEWYDASALTVRLGGASAAATNSRVWAIGWTAATRALVRQPLAPAAYQQAALASAVHAALLDFAPPGKPQLDAVLAGTLARIPDGQAKERGIAAGKAATAALLAERAGDGLDPASVDAAYHPQPVAPGIWQPTPPAHAPGIQYGLRRAKPFLLTGGSQFRPTPDPLGSERYLRDMEEVRVYGSADSTARTPEQTAVAQFWATTPLPIFTQVLRGALEQKASWPLAARAGLVAAFHVASVDTQIATADAKYAHVRWRPVTALRAAGHTGWTPLHETPPHPDYVSGHAAYAGAAEQVLTALTGPRPARPITASSVVAPGADRTYTSWRQFTQENLDARVWSGIHTRNADDAGAHLGRRVALHSLLHLPGLLF
ncbi:vanadium-dependent haloperoxidase [Nonomuraea sp. NPDC050394]|uniref:vanadium-dependent haloperoxidase n=1 Tax=Nonomuraea sp. NPDC050394 TaxID=3364363 RepID=UPI00378BBE0D